MKGIDFPKRVQIHHKLDQRVVELGFNGRTISEVLAVKNDWPDDIVVVQKGGTATLSINVPAVDIAKGIATQKEVLEKVIEAVQRLLPHARLPESIPPT